MSTRGPVVYRATTTVKAWIAGIALFVAWLTAAFGDDVLDWGELGEGIALLVTLVGGTFFTWLVPNKPKTDQ